MWGLLVRLGGNWFVQALAALGFTAYSLKEIGEGSEKLFKYVIVPGAIIYALITVLKKGK